MREETYWAVLHKLWEDMPRLGTILRALQGTISGEQLWKSSAQQLDAYEAILPAEYRQCLVAQRRKYDLSKVEHYLLQNNIHILLSTHAAYPALLREIHQPPAILYWKGNFNMQALQIAMVGSRKADRYGMETAETMAAQFSAAGIPIVSGLARGIDAAAHRGAIRHSGGTIAVQGCGIDQVYPKENKQLAEAILEHENSCIISEFPIGSQPAAWHFPMRNRIISGLSQGVVIVQAARKSGAYITVETALEQGRDVFAVPGQINNPLSEGPHQLLQEGAQLVTCAEDVLQTYGLVKKQKKSTEPNSAKSDDTNKNIAANKTKKSKANGTASDKQQMALFDKAPALLDISLSEKEYMVLNLFTAEPMQIEEAAYLSKLPMAELMSVLSMLELYGLIEPMVGRKYIRIG